MSVNGSLRIIFLGQLKLWKSIVLVLALTLPSVSSPLLWGDTSDAPPTSQTSVPEFVLKAIGSSETQASTMPATASAVPLAESSSPPAATTEPATATTSLSQQADDSRMAQYGYISLAIGTLIGIWGMMPILRDIVILQMIRMKEAKEWKSKGGD